MDRVVVTGIGAVTPLGNTFLEAWKAARAGKTGIGPITRFDTSGIPWKVAGELRGFDNPFLGPKELRRTDPFIHYAVAAAVMAAGDAGLLEGFGGKAAGQTGDRHREGSRSDYLGTGGIVMGSSRGGISTIEQALLKNSTARSFPSIRPSPYLMPATTTGMAASYAAQILGIKGHCLGISNACSSGLNAIGEAFRLLRHGHEGPILAGGSEAPICRLCAEGYGVSGALSRTADSSASRPFTVSRDGFVLAEGSCVVVLERLDAAMRRKTGIYCEITGYADTTDAFHQTRPDVEGEVRAMRQAIAAAGVRPEEIEYVNSHGSSTVLGDEAEAKAIASVFGKNTPRIPVSALKSMTGHMLAASGALEAAFTAMSLKEGTVPPTLNVSSEDRCSNILIEGKTLRKEIGLAITNSFGFGGVNASLVLKRLT